jgi:outer membrane protein OmpA-like peptidoglycan-associated protein
MARRLLGASAALLLALSACGPSATASLDREAGRLAPGFGEAVRSNALVARGEAPLVTMQGRFAAEVPSFVTFPFDSAALDAAARYSLDRQADWMRQFPELGFRVYGHADVIGPSPYNEALGRRRAEAVVAYLAARGVSRGRLEALVSFGERRPLVPDAGRERLNRRVVTEVAAFVSRHPTALNGRYAEVVFREYVLSAQVGPAVVAVPIAVE